MTTDEVLAKAYRTIRLYNMKHEEIYKEKLRLAELQAVFNRIEIVNAAAEVAKSLTEDQRDVLMTLYLSSSGVLLFDAASDVPVGVIVLVAGSVLRMKYADDEKRRIEISLSPAGRCVAEEWTYLIKESTE